MTTRMMHQQHGWTHAYGDGDIKRLEGLGWSVEAPKVPVINGDTSHAPEDAIVLPVVDVGRDSMIRPVSLEDGRDEMAPKRKPGRPRKAE